MKPCTLLLFLSFISTLSFVVSDTVPSNEGMCFVGVFTFFFRSQLFTHVILYLSAAKILLIIFFSKVLMC